MMTPALLPGTKVRNVLWEFKCWNDPNVCLHLETRGPRYQAADCESSVLQPMCMFIVKRLALVAVLGQ